MKLYIKAASKKAINERLAAGDQVTTIAVYDKLVGGTPYAKSWGTWDATLRRVK